MALPRSAGEGVFCAQCKGNPSCGGGFSSSLPSAPSSSPWLSAGPWAGMGVPGAQDTEGRPLPPTSHRTRSRWEGSGKRVPLCHSAPGRPAQPSPPLLQPQPPLPGPAVSPEGMGVLLPQPCPGPSPGTASAGAWPRYRAPAACTVRAGGWRTQSSGSEGSPGAPRWHGRPSALRPAPAQCLRVAGGRGSLSSLGPAEREEPKS